LTIRSPESDGPSESHLKRGIQPVQAVSCIIRIEPIHAVMELVLAWQEEQQIEWHYIAPGDAEWLCRKLQCVAAQ
jgi:hypothetical protein